MTTLFDRAHRHHRVVKTILTSLALIALIACGLVAGYYDATRSDTAIRPYDTVEAKYGPVVTGTVVGRLKYVSVARVQSVPNTPSWLESLLPKLGKIREESRWRLELSIKEGTDEKATIYFLDVPEQVYYDIKNGATVHIKQGVIVSYVNP